MQTHAATPVAEWICGDTFRIYFTCRDSRNRSSIGYVVINLNRPQDILELSAEPIIGPGETGLFDDCGTSLGSITTVGERRYLFYVGWTLGVTVPWFNTVGLAISRSTDPAVTPKFAKLGRGPLLDRSNVDPFSMSYPWVLHERGRWQMWYGSNSSATPLDRRRIPHVIRHATSDNGLEWARSETICIGSTAYEQQDGIVSFSRPTVLHDGELYRMWYSYRGSSYRIGYAESLDGLDWERADAKFGLLPVEYDWECNSTAYPSVFRHKDATYILYNGDQYGKTGFGLALTQEPLSNTPTPQPNLADIR